MADEDGGASPDECVEPAPSGAADSFSPWDEYDQAFGEPRPIPVVTAADTGMPNLAPELDGHPQHAPPFTLATFCCIADTSVFCLRGEWGEVVGEFKADEVTRAPDGRYRVASSVAVERAAAAIEAKRTELEHYPPADQGPTEREQYEADLHDSLIVLGALVNGRDKTKRPYYFDAVHFEVRPVREQCSHFLSQLQPPQPGQPLKKGWMYYYCTARRNVAGAFMELTNDAMRACSLRDPPDAHGSAVMAEFMVSKAAESATRVLHQMFDLKPPPGEPKLGIFTKPTV